METQTGAEILRRSLVREGVDVVFGYPGGAILPFYDALHGRRDPRHVLVRHEQSAAHAADGYARATGRVGVCVATSGPGASNLVTGLGTALMDSVPVVAITGQVPSGAMGTDAFQEIDVVGLTMPVTKHAFLVRDADDIPEIVAEAFHVARSGRPGPTVVDIPKDVQQAHAAPPAGLAIRSPLPCTNGAKTPDAPVVALEPVRVLLAAAERPVIMAGRGVVLSGMADSLRAFAETHELPVITTLLGLDAFPSGHPLCLGMPGMHGTERANLAIQRADLVIGLGLRFDDRVTGHVPGFAPHAHIVHFDISEAVAGRTVRPHIRVIGNLTRTLPALARGARARALDAWWRELGGWEREAEPAEVALTGPGPLSGRAASRILGRWIGDRGAIVATDVGQHQMWLAQELRNARPASHLTSGGLGTMGFALPAAIGAQLGRPDREVWAFMGDGGFQMSAHELATVAQERLPIRIAVLNNAALGLVWQWQSLSYAERYVASRLSGPDLELLGRSYGIPAWSVRRTDELTRTLERIDRIAGPVLVDIRVPTEEYVYPMVRPGSTLSEMLRGGEPALS